MIDNASNFILEAHNVVRRFGAFLAVDDVSFAVKRGSVHALIGPNGAGKTTFFNVLSKFLQPSSGRIVFDGEDISRTEPSLVARRGLVRSFQISAVFQTMTVLENVKVALQSARGNSFDFWESGKILNRYDQRARELLELVGLTDRADVLASQLAYGRKRSLEIATTLALEPKMLLLDEPTAGMGTEDIDRMIALIRQVAKGKTVLMVEHNLSVVSSLSDQISVLARGKLIASGDYNSVANDPLVKKAYMGSGHA